MARLKTFRIYIILFLLFYLFVSLMSYGFVKSGYKPIENYNIEFNNPKVTIKKAESTKVNGYIEGTINNDTSETINKYLKIDLFSENGNYIYTKYVEIATLIPGNEMKFNVKFNAENIRSFKVNIVDEEAVIDNMSSKWKWNIYEVLTTVGLVFLAVKFIPMIF